MTGNEFASTERDEGQIAQPGEAEEQEQQSRWVFIISGIIILSLVGAYFVVPSFQQFVNQAIDVLTSNDQQRIKTWVSGFGVGGPLFIIAAMIAQMFLIIIPSVVLMVVSTLAYGPLWGSLLSLTAVLVASSIAYYIGWHTGQAVVDKLIGKKAEEKMNHYIQTYGAWAIVLFRVSPFLSNDAISFAAGIGEMRYLKFILATAVGIVPLIAVIAYVGQDTETLESSMLWISGITAVAFVGYFIFKKTKGKKQRS